MSNSLVRQYLPGDFTPGSFTQHNMGLTFRVWKNIQHLVFKAMDECAFDPRGGQPFRVAEFGANDGGTSVPIMTEIIDLIRAKHGEETEVEIIYEDQPCNDFNSLFMLSQGLVPGHDPICLKKRNIFISAVGHSFHKRCFPSGTIHLAISASSLHHLSESPCPCLDSYFPMLLPVNHPVFIKYSTQARKDWVAFLLHRAKELVAGGLLVLAALCQVPHPSQPGMVDFSNRSVVSILNGLWKEMANQGLITQEECESVLALVFMCSMSEFRAPFDDPTSPVTKAGLKLISVTYHVTPVAKYDNLSPREAAKRRTDYVRSFSSWPFLSALSQRSELEKQKLVDHLFGSYEEKLVYNDNIAPSDPHHAYMLIQKI